MKRTELKQIIKEVHEEMINEASIRGDEHGLIIKNVVEIMPNDDGGINIDNGKYDIDLSSKETLSLINFLKKMMI